jgi:hypothetical protein
VWRAGAPAHAREEARDELARAGEIAERVPRHDEIDPRLEQIGVVGGQEARPGLVHGFE